MKDEGKAILLPASCDAGKNSPISPWSNFPHFVSKTIFFVINHPSYIRTNVLREKKRRKKNYGTLSNHCAHY
jgi:hypothetical protein